MKSAALGVCRISHEIEYTTLPETRDRLLATSLDRDVAVPGHAISTSIRPGARCGTRLLETFAEHHSESVQHTLHAMGQAVLDASTRSRASAS